jgi:hypothetical protein
MILCFLSQPCVNFDSRLKEAQVVASEVDIDYLLQQRDMLKTTRTMPQQDPQLLGFHSVSLNRFDGGCSTVAEE